MKKLWFIPAIVGLALSTSSQAMALTTESRNDQNADATSKFSDPDEQKPAFMVNAPNGGDNSSHAQSNGFSGVTLPSMGDNTPGARAFDDAVSRQQNR